jgi:hypothetical protein
VSAACSTSVIHSEISEKYIYKIVADKFCEQNADNLLLFFREKMQTTVPTTITDEKSESTTTATMTTTSTATTTTTLPAPAAENGSSAKPTATNTNNCNKSPPAPPPPDLLEWKDMPRHLQFNPYVLKGYRPLQSFTECVHSLFYLHNETINILTHGE